MSLSTLTAVGALLDRTNHSKSGEIKMRGDVSWSTHAVQYSDGFIGQAEGLSKSFE